MAQTMRLGNTAPRIVLARPRGIPRLVSSRRLLCFATTMICAYDLLDFVWNKPTPLPSRLPLVVRINHCRIVTPPPFRSLSLLAHPTRLQALRDEINKSMGGGGEQRPSIANNLERDGLVEDELPLRLDVSIDGGESHTIEYHPRQVPACLACRHVSTRQLSGSLTGSSTLAAVIKRHRFVRVSCAIHRHGGRGYRLRGTGFVLLLQV